MLVSQLAQQLGVRFEGDGARDIVTAAALEDAGPDDLSFVTSAKFYNAAIESSAGCLVVPRDYENASNRTILRADQPRGVFSAAVALLYPDPPIRPGIHPLADVHPAASVDPSAEVGPHVTIGAGARIGANCRIGPGCSLGTGSSVGPYSTLHAGVTLYSGVSVGSRCVLHSGCVLGADGFGFVLAGDRYRKFPQVGRVEVGDDVELGANTCVDRAALGVTRIGDGTKLDNMVHIGHNCRIGKHVVIAAQTGLSGGVVVEDYAVIGGQVGIGDKARIESRAVLGSGCGILTSKIVRGGQVVWGTPARPLKQHLQQLANLAKLPELRRELDELRARLSDLEKAP